MKRVFIINGRSKEAPKNLNETPAKGSLIAYNHALYAVSDVVYYFDDKLIQIILKRE